MLTLTAAEHLASVRARLETGNPDEQGYNDLAVIALFYAMNAKDRKDKEEGMVLCDMAVRQRAAMQVLDTKLKIKANERLIQMCLEELRERNLALIPPNVAELVREKGLAFSGDYEQLLAMVWKLRNDPDAEQAYKCMIEKDREE